MDTFGCCSHYKKCSDYGACLFLKNEDYEGCYYRKNLESGNVFYGSTKSVVKMVTKNILPESIYISCYDRYFRIAHLSRNGWSYPLKDDEKELLLEKLKFLEIPFKIEDDESKCIVEGDEVEPANARVYFSFSQDSQKFSVANYNAYYIKKRYADGIANSLIKKGLIAKVELIGTYARITEYERKTIIRNDEVKEIKPVLETPKVIQNNTKKPIYQQISIFEFVS